MSRPMDIRQQQFTVKMFRGFDVQEVDTFLEDLAGDYETLLKENALLKEQLQPLEERTRGLEERERVLQETLVTTHKVVEEMKEGAKRDAALAVREAKLAGGEDSRGRPSRGGDDARRGGGAEAHPPPARGVASLDDRDVSSPRGAGRSDRPG